MQFSNTCKNQWGSPAGRLLAALCTLLLISALSVPPALAHGGLETAVICNRNQIPYHTGQAGLWESPSQSSASLGHYYNGVSVDVLEHTSEDWAKVRIGTEPGCAQGYMMTQYLVSGDTDIHVGKECPTTEANAIRWEITAAPQAGSPSVGVYGYGEYTDLLGYSPGWWHLRLWADGQTGYFPAQNQQLRVLNGMYYSGFDTAVIHTPDPEDRLALRAEATQTSALLGEYYNGIPVAVLQTDDGEWVSVRIGTLDGYMQRTSLLFNTPVDGLPFTLPAITIDRTARLLTLREKPTVYSKALGSCYGGSEVQVLGVSKYWYHVQAGGQIGFMVARYLTPQLPCDAEDPDNGEFEDNGKGWDGPVGQHAVAQWPLSAAEYAAVVNNPDPRDRLHLRTGTSREATSLGKYYNGVTVTIHGELPDGWTSVSIGNQLGYMKTEYLAINAAVPPASAMPVMTVNHPDGSQPLREHQFTKSRSLGLYTNGTQVVLMGFNGPWAHVIVDGNMGFMLGQYLQ